MNVYNQNNPQNFLELKTLVENYPISYCKKLKKSNKHLLNWINSQLSLLDDSYHISTKCYWILNGLVDFPKCRKCGKPIDKKKIKIFKGYQQFCSTKCATHSIERQITRKQTCLEKYGVEHPSKSEKVKTKTKQTCLEKYGVEHQFKNEKVKEKIKQICLKKYGVDNPLKSEVFKEKRKQTCLEKYGVNNVAKMDVVKEKCKKTCLEKYGVDNPLKSKEIKEKYKQTCLEKYGVDNALKTKEVREKIKQTYLEKYGVDNALKSKEIKEKRKNTWLKTYGVDNPSKLEQIKEKRRKTFLKNYGVDNPFKSIEIKEKFKQTFLEKYGYEHPMQNHDIRLKAQKRYSYNDIHFDSSPELAYYIWIKDHNIEFEYQPNISFEYVYDGKKYIYMPDFKVEDQYVELKGDQFLNENGTWQNPWNHNEDDLYEAKHQCCLKNNVKILYSKDYQQYLDYIAEKYGKDYLKQFKQK